MTPTERYKKALSADNAINRATRFCPLSPVMMSNRAYFLEMLKQDAERYERQEINNNILSPPHAGEGAIKPKPKDTTMTKTQAVRIAQDRVTMHKLGSNWIVSTCEPENQWSRQAQHNTHPEARQAVGEIRIAIAMELLGHDKYAVQNAVSEYRHNGGYWIDYVEVKA
jgi:hypothetical protein